MLAEAIADALRQNTRITEINLESNEIGGEGVAALAAVIARSKSIVKVCFPCAHFPAFLDSGGLLKASVVCSALCCRFG